MRPALPTITETPIRATPAVAISMHIRHYKNNDIAAPRCYKILNIMAPNSRVRVKIDRNDYRAAAPTDGALSR